MLGKVLGVLLFLFFLAAIIISLYMLTWIPIIVCLAGAAVIACLFAIWGLKGGSAPEPNKRFSHEQLIVDEIEQLRGLIKDIEGLEYLNLPEDLKYSQSTEKVTDTPTQTMQHLKGYYVRQELLLINEYKANNDIPHDRQAVSGLLEKLIIDSSIFGFARPGLAIMHPEIKKQLGVEVIEK